VFVFGFVDTSVCRRLAITVNGNVGLRGWDEDGGVIGRDYLSISVFSFCCGGGGMGNGVRSRREGYGIDAIHEGSDGV